MKNFRILTYTLLAMLFVIFSGCEKSETEPALNLQNKYSAQEKIMQNGISAYNNIIAQVTVDTQDGESVIERDGEGIFEEEFGTPTQSRVFYKRDNKELS